MILLDPLEGNKIVLLVAVYYIVRYPVKETVAQVYLSWKGRFFKL
jgi:hypothetical protein